MSGSRGGEVTDVGYSQGFIQSFDFWGVSKFSWGGVLGGEGCKSLGRVHARRCGIFILGCVCGGKNHLGGGFGRCRNARLLLLNEDHTPH